MKPVLVSVALLLLAGCGGDQAPDPYVQSVDTWHAGRIERLQADDGWLTLVGLHELQIGSNTVGIAAGSDIRLDAAAPEEVGRFDLAADGVTFTPSADTEVLVEGATVTETIAVATDADGKPTVLHVGTVSCQVIARGDRLFLRVKDRASKVLRDFQGVDRFAVDASWRLTARLETAGMPRTVPITNVLGQVEQQPCPGVLVFELDGRHHRLVPVGKVGEPMFLVFGDRTNGHDTYGGGRFLSIDTPGPDGTVVLDFNRAINPPCAFTPHATCPVPPRENQLPVRVPAGEKVWGKKH